MSLQLPSQLTTVLQATGFMWPASDEDKLHDLARAWADLARDLPPMIASADAAAARAWQQNSGASTAEYKQTWHAGDGPSPQLQLGTTGSEIIAAGLTMCAGAVLALKLGAAAQLAVLAAQMSAAVGTAVATGGASLLSVPVWQNTTRLILDQLLNQAIGLVLNG